jgi:thermostable 8-oxoguanine DNA glycosylase
MPERNIRVFDSTSDLLQYNFDYNAVETTALRNRTYENVSIDDLRRIALWKLDRVVDVPDSLLAALRDLAAKQELTVASKESREALEALVQCDGIGYPMASAFLKFIRPDVFPIIDVRAYRALTGKRLRYNDYSTELYLEYVVKLREIADCLDMPLATIDEQLYCYDKHLNGSIND